MTQWSAVVVAIACLLLLTSALEWLSEDNRMVWVLLLAAAVLVSVSGVRLVRARTRMAIGQNSVPELDAR
jgi:multidrug transporter EmrE-like cation transporter